MAIHFHLLTFHLLKCNEHKERALNIRHGHPPMLRRAAEDLNISSSNGLSILLPPVGTLENHQFGWLESPSSDGPITMSEHVGMLTSPFQDGSIAISRHFHSQIKLRFSTWLPPRCWYPRIEPRPGVRDVLMVTRDPIY